MLSFQLLTEKDRREAATLERRRSLEEERKKRIFNPRNRIIGVDIGKLNAQIEEKKKKEAEERHVEKLFEQHLIKSDQIAIALERKEREERYKLQQEINNYRKNYQKSEDRREFDLNDPDLIKKQLPCRVHDEDPRLGLSSAQKFEGEDLSSEQRQKIQHEEIRAWLDQQMQEKDSAEKERKAAEEAYKAAVIARDQRALEMDRLEKECRKKIHEACLRFNKALADEKNYHKQNLERQTREDNTAEIYNALTSDMLTENPELAQSNLGVGRRIGNMYKGMTAEERKIIREQQLAQIEEAKRKREMEQRMNKEMDEYINGIQKTVYLMDKDMEAKQRQLNKQVAEENKKLAEQHNNHKKFLDKVVYTNVPTDDFFGQFNKSSR